MIPKTNINLSPYRIYNIEHTEQKLLNKFDKPLKTPTQHGDALILLHIINKSNSYQKNQANQRDQGTKRSKPIKEIKEPKEASQSKKSRNQKNQANQRNQGTKRIKPLEVANNEAWRKYLSRENGRVTSRGALGFQRPSHKLNRTDQMQQDGTRGEKGECPFISYNYNKFWIQRSTQNACYQNQ